MKPPSLRAFGVLLLLFGTFVFLRTASRKPLELSLEAKEMGRPTGGRVIFRKATGQTARAILQNGDEIRTTRDTQADILLPALSIRVREETTVVMNEVHGASQTVHAD